MAENGYFWPKTRLFKGQNVHNLGGMGQYIESLMEYNELNRSIRMLGQKSCKNDVLRAKFVKNGQKWPTSPTLDLLFT